MITGPKVRIGTTEANEERWKKCTVSEKSNALVARGV